MRFGIVSSGFHKEISEAMLEAAKKKAKQLKISIEVANVPGAYEAPLAVKRFLSRKDIDAAVVLGYIEKGETLHGEQMGMVVSGILKELELRYNKPVGMGIIGPGATPGQARKRAHYAPRAVEAAYRIAKSIKY